MSDTEARNAIRLAFDDLTKAGKVCNSVSVPTKAAEILGGESLNRVLAEIDLMEQRQALYAPLPPSKPWRLLP